MADVVDRHRALMVELACEVYQAAEAEGIAAQQTAGLIGTQRAGFAARLLAAVRKVEGALGCAERVVQASGTKVGVTEVEDVAVTGE